MEMEEVENMDELIDEFYKACLNGEFHFMSEPETVESNRGSGYELKREMERASSFSVYVPHPKNSSNKHEYIQELPFCESSNIPLR